MKKLIRIFALTMAVLTLVVSLSACITKKDNDENESNDSSEVVESNSSALGDTGIEIRDFGGKSMNIWYSTQTTWEPYPLSVTSTEANSGDIVMEAGYKRNQTFEKTFNVLITYLPSDTDPNRGTALTELRTNWNSGVTDNYDIVMTGANTCGPLAVEGFYYDLNQSGYINPTAYYYESQVNEQLQFYGKQYFAAGYYSVMNTAAMDFTFVNYGIVESVTQGEVTLDTLYDKALNKEWTFDYLMYLGKLFSTETENAAWNGQGNCDYDYAWILSQRYTQALYYDFGGTAVEFNEDKGEYINSLNTETNKLLLSWIQDNIVSVRDTEIGFIVDDKHYDAFLDGAAPFMTVSLADLTSVVDSDLLWSLLPAPLKSEGDTYRSYSDAWNLNFAGVPAGTRDPDKSTYLYEMFMALSYDIVYPAYYEKCFETRYQPDEKSAQVFDLIAHSRVVCTANIYGFFSTARLADICRNLSFGVDSTVTELSTSLDTGIASFKPKE